MRSHRGCVAVPSSSHYWLEQATVPCYCLEGASQGDFEQTVDQTAIVDIEISKGRIRSIIPSGSANLQNADATDCQGSMVWPTFADLHTHIDKSHTCERSRNLDGSLSGADRSTAQDAAFWDKEDIYRRMDYSISCAYAHGTSALRTHLINMTPLQTKLTWPTFKALREQWAGKVELQGVALVVLSFFRDAEAARQLADTVQEHGGILGAAICCAENGGDDSDDWTTCCRDRNKLLDRIFELAKERDLDLDFHVDENGNLGAKGLLYVARKTIQHGYQGRVVCGHCCSLVLQPKSEQQHIIQVAREAKITIVSLPLVNE